MIYFLKNAYVIMPFCFGFGLLFTIITTVPYKIIFEFMKDEKYVQRDTHSIKRGRLFKST